MDRDIDSNDRQDLLEKARKIPQPDARDAQPSREHDIVRVGGYSYRLSTAELDAMHDIGRFRTVETADLARFRYHGKRAQMQEDLRSLHAQRLVQFRTVWSGPRSVKLAVAVLTKRGKEVLDRNRQSEKGQASY